MRQTARSACPSEIDPMNVHSPPWLSTSPYSGLLRFLLGVWRRRALISIKSRPGKI
jgi:hypothetical protein